MRRVVEVYYRVLKFVLTALMGLIMIPVILQIAARYVSFVPHYIWTEEIARFCFIWIILVGSMVAVRDRSHFTVDLLPQPKTPRGEGIARMLVDVVVLAVAVVFVVWGWPLAKFGLMQTSEISGLPMITIYIAWPLAGITWIVFLAESFADNLRRLRGETV